MVNYASGSIRFSGLGSDTDFESMITKLVAIESRQVTQLMRWKTDWQTRLDAFKQVRSELMNLQSALTGLNSMDKFLAKTTSSTDDKKVTATAASDAANISYNIKVKQKATNTYWTKELGLHDRTDSVCDTPGGGSFEYSYKGVYRTVNVPQGTTVEGLIKLINNDSKNPGVKAQMIQTIDGISFQLRGMDTGTTNTLVIRNTTNLNGLDVAPGAVNYDDTQNSARYRTGFSAAERSEELIPASGETQTFIYTVDDKRYTVDIEPGKSIDWLVDQINAKTPQTPPLAEMVDGGDGNFYFTLQKKNTTYTFTPDPDDGGNGPLKAILDATYSDLGASINDGPGDIEVKLGCLADPPTQTFDDATITIPPGTTVQAFVNALQKACGKRGTAALVKDPDNPGNYKISITPKDKEHRVTVQSGSYEPLSYVPPSSPGWDVTHAQNALVKINDVPSGDKWMEFSSNTLKSDEVIPGMTFNILGTTDDEGVEIAVTNDTAKMMENIQAFVDAVNSFRTVLASLSSYDEEKEQLDVEYAESQFEMQKGNVLMGNYGIQLVSSRLKSAVAGASLGFTPLMKDAEGLVLGGDLYSALSQIGITTNATQGESSYGLLEINTISGTKGARSLAECLEEDPEAVARLFAAKGEGRSNSPDLFHYDSHINTVTKPGTYDVKYTVNADGTIDPSSATIGGKSCSVSGNTITCTDGAAKGLVMTVIAREGGQSYSGSVSIADGKINELLGMLEGSEGLLGSKGTLRTLESNYEDIIKGIEGKIQREDERLTKFERNMTLKFARLEEVLSRYNGIQKTLENQLSQLSSNSSKK